MYNPSETDRTSLGAVGKWSPFCGARCLLHQDSLVRGVHGKWQNSSFRCRKRSLSGSQAPDIIFSPALPGFFPLLPDVLSVAERWTFLKEAVWMLV